MRTPGIGFHNIPLFVWAIFVTAILLLLSLPVLAGKNYCVVSALNLTICWKFFFILFYLIKKDNQQVTVEVDKWTAKPLSTDNRR